VDDLKSLVGTLQDSGCLRLREDHRPGPGRPPSPIIEIHPDLRQDIRTIRNNDPKEGGESVIANSAMQSGGVPRKQYGLPGPDAEPLVREVPDLFSGGVG
jgi:hypothetical protein